MLSRKVLTIVILISILITSAQLLAGIKGNKRENKYTTVLWAWERPEYLNFLKNTDTGVAFLAGSIEFRDSLIKSVPRLQPLSVDSDTIMTEVVRIDNIDHRDMNFTDKELTAISEFIVRMCSQKGKITHCQIDFDALESEREFYKNLIHDVRKKLPEKLSLSITALSTSDTSNN
ncbi:hypothetical protein HZB69_04275 [Candidatus Amesbacteria bacterium]|nr:hypothetical protein [Candidatus Amesbacteria bacterium]